MIKLTYVQKRFSFLFFLKNGKFFYFNGKNIKGIVKINKNENDIFHLTISANDYKVGFYGRNTKTFIEGLSFAYGRVNYLPMSFSEIATMMTISLDEAKRIVHNHCNLYDKLLLVEEKFKGKVIKRIYFKAVEYSFKYKDLNISLKDKNGIWSVENIQIVKENVNIYLLNCFYIKSKDEYCVIYIEYEKVKMRLYETSIYVDSPWTLIIVNGKIHIFRGKEIKDVCFVDVEGNVNVLNQDALIVSSKDGWRTKKFLKQFRKSMNLSTPIGKYEWSDLAFIFSVTEKEIKNFLHTWFPSLARKIDKTEKGYDYLFFENLIYK